MFLCSTWEGSHPSNSKPTCSCEANLLSAFVVASIYVHTKRTWNIPTTVATIGVSYSTTAELSNVLTLGSNRRPPSLKKVLPQTLKQSKTRTMSTAGRHWGTTRSGRAVFSQWLCFRAHVRVFTLEKSQLILNVPFQWKLLSYSQSQGVHELSTKPSEHSSLQPIVLKKIPSPKATKSKWRSEAFSNTAWTLEFEVEAQCDFRVNTCIGTTQHRFLFSGNMKDDILYATVRKYAIFKHEIHFFKFYIFSRTCFNTFHIFNITKNYYYYYYYIIEFIFPNITFLSNIFKSR